MPEYFLDAARHHEMHNGIKAIKISLSKDLIMPLQLNVHD